MDRIWINSRAVCGQSPCLAGKSKILSRLYPRQLWPPSTQRDSLHSPLNPRPFSCYKCVSTTMFDSCIWDKSRDTNRVHFRTIPGVSGVAENIVYSPLELRAPVTTHRKRFTKINVTFLSINDKTVLLTYRKPSVQLWWRVSPRWKGPRPQ